MADNNDNSLGVVGATGAAVVGAGATAGIAYGKAAYDTRDASLEAVKKTGTDLVEKAGKAHEALKLEEAELKHLAAHVTDGKLGRGVDTVKNALKTLEEAGKVEGADKAVLEKIAEKIKPVLAAEEAVVKNSKLLADNTALQTAWKEMKWTEKLTKSLERAPKTNLAIAAIATGVGAYLSTSLFSSRDQAALSGDTRQMGA